MNKLLLEANDIRLSYALRDVLNVERFEVREGDRIGLVGENGAGKTSFLKILSGELSPDTGHVARHARVSVIHQMDEGGALGESDARIAGEFRVQPEREGLSGGERTRRRITSALSERGHVLLADEPTSDLDREGIERLERALIGYEGALVLISHDRALLDAVCTTIVELQDARLRAYPGNYSAYRAEKERQVDFQRFEYQQYRAEQGRLRASIQGKKAHASQVGKLPSRMGNSEARLHKRSATEVEEKLHKTRKALESRLEQLEEKERPREEPSIRMALGSASAITSRTAVEIKDMTMRFGGRALLEGASMRLYTGSRTALMGENGCGKTTLIARILGKDPRVRVSPGVKIGWFGQNHEQVLDLERTALENAMAESVYPEADVRTVLARLNLRGDQALKKAGVLSGGERAKVCLARLFVSQVNLLILDEPTNHLDVYALEALQEVLAGYAGTLLLVSHDRRFVGHVATRVVMFEGTRLVTHEGSLADYEEARTRAQAASARDAGLERMTVELRMAELAGRMSRPRKGDDPEKLKEAYDQMVEKLRKMPG